MEEICLSPRKTLRISFIGDHKVGKTTFLNNNIENYCLEKVDITLATTIITRDYIDGVQNIRFLIFDTPGFKSMRQLINYYIKNCDCLVIVFSLSSENSFENLSSWLNYVKEQNPKYNEGLVILLGIEHDYSLISHQKVKEYADRHDFVYLPADIDEPMEEIYRQVINFELNTKNCKYSKKSHCSCNIM